MKAEIEAALREIGDEALVEQWHQQYKNIPIKPLPTAYIDEFALAYAVGLGVTAATIDLIADKAFRKEMKEKHDKLSDEEEKKEGGEINRVRLSSRI